jgi:hypothetical protein
MPGDMAGQLEYAANRIGDASRADLQVMLRRAALMIRNAAISAWLRAVNPQPNRSMNSLVDLSWIYYQFSDVLVDSRK